MSLLVEGVGTLLHEALRISEDSYRQEHAPHALYMQHAIIDSTKNVFLTLHSLMGGHLTPALAVRATVQPHAHTRKCIVKCFVMG